MADFDSSLPIRTEGAGDVIVKIADATIPAQQLAVEADGSINVNASVVIPAGQKIIVTDGTDDLEVNGDGSINVVATATDLDIRDLTSVSDSVEVLQATHDNLNANVNLQVGDVDVANGNPVPISDAGGSLTVDAIDLDIRDLAFATDSVDVSGSSVTVSATDLDIRDLTHASDSVKVGDGSDFLAVNSDGSINVVLLNDVPGTEICNRQTSASVAAGASVNHDYTVTALKTFTAEAVQVAASGKCKVQVLFNGVIKFDAFNSTANPTILIPMYRMIKAAAGQVVRITITNTDNQAQDLYSTLMGSETP